jgi:hypothetical protein
VAATQGLPLPLAEKVESLSGYRPLYPPLDAKGNQNPVVHSHLRITVGGKTYSVLSRISPAGLDYSQRANKFAHHVILEAGELPARGPAWLLGQPGFMESQWDGEVRVIPSGRLPADGDAAPAVCRSWREVTGDAGWGGILADWFERDPNRQVYLLFEPGLDLLPLIAETVALLPIERRWQVSFSTYFTGLPQGIPCLWRCVVKDSPEAGNASRLPGQQVLNLCEPLGQAPEGDFVTKARTGAKLARAGIRGREEIVTAWPEGLDIAPSGGEADFPRISCGAAPSGGRSERKGPTSLPVGKSSSPTSMALSGQPGNSSPIPPPVRPTKKVSKIWILSGAIGLLCGALSGMLVASNYFPGVNDNNAVNESSAKSEEDTRAELNKRKEEMAKLSKQVEDLGLTNKVQQEDLAKARAEKANTDETVKGIKRENDNLTREKKGLGDELSEIKAKYNLKPLPIVDRRFALPEWVKSAQGSKTTVAIPFVDLGLKGEKNYKLSQLLGLDKSLKQNSEDGILRVHLNDGDKNSKLATLRIQKDKLVFEWHPNGEQKYKQAQWLLRDCVLEIIGSEKPVYVALRTPIPMRDDEMRFSSSLRPPTLDLLKDEVQGKPSKDLYFGSIEMQLNEDEFRPNNIQAKDRPQLTILSRAVYMKVGDLYVEVATIENHGNKQPK